MSFLWLAHHHHCLLSYLVIRLFSLLQVRDSLPAQLCLLLFRRRLEVVRLTQKLKERSLVFLPYSRPYVPHVLH